MPNANVSGGAAHPPPRVCGPDSGHRALPSDERVSSAAPTAACRLPPLGPEDDSDAALLLSRAVHRELREADGRALAWVGAHGSRRTDAAAYAEIGDLYDTLASCIETALGATARDPRPELRDVLMLQVQITEVYCAALGNYAQALSRDGTHTRALAQIAAYGESFEAACQCTVPFRSGRPRRID